MILLNPGPVTLSARVRTALTRPDLCHREPEFFDLQDDVRHRLLEVYALDPAEWSAVLLTGSGTAAVEAMVSSLVSGSGRLLVVENGVYGERMSEMARRHRIEAVRVHAPWGAPIPLEEVQRHLHEDRGITQVAVVHHETTTGRLNDLRALSELCRNRGVGLLMDAVSSFGAEAIDFAGTTACAATANKCLHGAPGISFVIARRSALAAADSARTLYLDLASYARTQDRRDTPFTPAVHVLEALREALAEHSEAGGWSARHSLYAERSSQVERGFAGAGVRPLLPTAESSVVLRAYRLPEGVAYERLHDHLKKRGFVIYAGQGALKADLFRIAVMGELAESDLNRLVRGLAEVSGQAARSSSPPPGKRATEATA